MSLIVVTAGYGTNVPTFRIAQGASNIYANIEKLIEESSEVVYVVTTIKDISKMYHTNIPEKIRVWKSSCLYASCIDNRINY